MEQQIIHLPKAEWQGHILPAGQAEYCYEATVEQTSGSFLIRLLRRGADQARAGTAPQQRQLYSNAYLGTYAWGVVENGQLVAAIETCPKQEGRRLLITQLWVEAAHRRRGQAQRLLEVAKEQLRLERRRALAAHIPCSCADAVDFYLGQGFSLAGVDLSGCIQSAPGEGCLTLALDVPRREKLQPQQVVIRPEQPEDEAAVEQMVQRAFWNKFRPGCTEHWLVHQLRRHPDYLPHLSRVALVDGQIAGCIMYARAALQTEKDVVPVLTFGPLCVDPALQGCGVGGLLLDQTLALARQDEWPGVIIFGEPEYYPRHGFVPCDRFGIATAEGENFDPFMGLELMPGALQGIGGRFVESPVYAPPEAQQLRTYEQTLPPMVRQQFPGQWQPEI